MIRLMNALLRKKNLNTNIENNTSNLGKHLGVIDLIFLGVGSTLGVGIYIISGTVAKEMAGPATSISFLLAAFISILAGISYAEFGARTPLAGSIYSYSYVAIGEFVAFIMGWNLITQYLIGASSVIKALSVYGDTFVNNSIQNYLIGICEINVPLLAKYFDVVAFALSILLAISLSYGLSESMIFNNILTSLNIAMVLFFVIFGSFYDNWGLSSNVVPSDAGNGGFLPYGWSGVLKGTGTCFFGFIGFDCISTTGEEVKNAQKTLPISLITSIFITFLAYFGISSILTLIVPYYLEDETAPLSFAFEYIGQNWATNLINIGTLFGLSASLIGASFPISRIMYAMAQDGLLYQILGSVSLNYGTPVVATMISGIGVGITAALFDVNSLIKLNSLGTLLSYSIIALCIIILRFTEKKNEMKTLYLEIRYTESISSSNEITELLPKKVTVKQLENVDIIIPCILTVFLASLPYWSVNMSCKIIIFFSLAFVLLYFFIRLGSQESKVQSNLSFKVPMVPFLPLLSIFANVYFMLQFELYMWILLLFWLVMGLLIYFTYGIFHSKERTANI